MKNLLTIALLGAALTLQGCHFSKKKDKVKPHHQKMTSKKSKAYGKKSSKIKKNEHAEEHAEEHTERKKDTKSSGYCK